MNPDEINKFSLTIEERVYMKDISFIDAIVEYCDETGLELETAAKLVSGVLRAKIQSEAEDLHYLRRSETNSLPL